MIIIIIAMLGVLALLVAMLMVFNRPINYWLLDSRYKMSKEDAAQLFKHLEPQFYSYDSTGKVIREEMSSEKEVS